MAFRRAFRRRLRAAGPKLKRYGAGAVASAVAQRMANSTTLTRTMASDEPGGALTAQFDAKTDYRRRRMSRRKRRIQRSRYRRTRKLVRTVRNFNIGSSHINKVNYGLVTNASGSTVACCYGLYGLNGSTSALNSTNDMREIFNDIDPASWLAQGGTTDAQTFKLYAQHATAEYTIRNSSTTDDAIVEAYFIRGRTAANATFYPSPTDVFDRGFHKQATAKDPTTGNAIGTPMAFTDVGVTPFQNTLFCRLYSIYRRQKFRIPPGAEVSFVLTDRRPRTLRMDLSYPNATDRNYHGVLFQVYGSPQASGATPTLATSVPVTFMCARRYRFKMYRDNLPLDGTV